MITNSIQAANPKTTLPLDNAFRPAALWNRNFAHVVRSSKKGLPLHIAVERGDDSISVFKTQVLPSSHPLASENLFYAEKLVKMLLWTRGGYKVIVGGPKEIGEHIKKVYSLKGKRAFDANFMAIVYEKPFIVKITEADKVPQSKEKTVASGRHFDGCRIGFDLGASDRKVSAVINGKSVFSEEVIWDPRNQTNSKYHYHEIMAGLHRAAAHMPRIDAIGGSSAGIIIKNRVMMASLFRGIPRELFKKMVTNIFIDIRKKWGVPFEVINDGEVTALAASMSLKIHSVMGIALGSSQAAGYITPNGQITNWLNELAFAPVDFNPDAPLDEWSGDSGCGTQYFSQVAVIRLSKKSGINLAANLTPAEKLKSVQDLLEKNDSRARKIFETIGCYLGYGIAHYADFYDFKHVLILGRVTSGDSGPIILENAQHVLIKEFPELAKKIAIHLPDERSRRVGQSIAAASLPLIRKKRGK